MRPVVLVGMKSSGKTSVGRCLAEALGASFLDVDAALEQQHRDDRQETLGYREIFSRYGAAYFRALETATLERLASRLAGSRVVLATGGGTPLPERNRELLRALGLIVFLDVEAPVLLPRITAQGVPAFFPYQDDPARSLDELLAARQPIYASLADLVVVCGVDPPELLAQRIVEGLAGVAPGRTGMPG